MHALTQSPSLIRAGLSDKVGPFLAAACCLFKTPHWNSDRGTQATPPNSFKKGNRFITRAKQSVVRQRRADKTWSGRLIKKQSHASHQHPEVQSL